MKSKLRTPFRAPRKTGSRSNQGKEAEQLGAAQEQPPHDRVQGEGGIVTGKAPTVVAASPNLEEFETYLESLGAELNTSVPVVVRCDGVIEMSVRDKGKGIALVAAKKRKKALNTKKAKRKVNNKEDSDESEDLETFGDIALRALSNRQALSKVSSRVQNEHLRPPETDEHSVTVSVEDILFDDRSIDDDVPIVSTLPSPQTKRKDRIKAKVKWTYETVLEPTGVASKYWDADAPAERATKRLAKEKLVALTASEAESNSKGMSTCGTMTLDLALICSNYYSFINY